MTATDKKPNIYQKVVQIMNDVGVIEKTGRNSTQNYSFIEQAVVVATIRPLLVKHGVAIIPSTPETEIERYVGEKTDKYGTKTTVTVHSKVRNCYRVVNIDDPSDFFESEWVGEAFDTSDKATNKALTASNKTYLMKLFNISDVEDADRETIEAPKPVEKSGFRATHKQLEAMMAIAKENGCDDREQALLWIESKAGKHPLQMSVAEASRFISEFN